MVCENKFLVLCLSSQTLSGSSVLNLDEEAALITATPTLNDIYNVFCNNEKTGHRYQEIIPNHHRSKAKNRYISTALMLVGLTAMEKYE
jgi:hypothetical protein